MSLRMCSAVSFNLKADFFVFPPASKTFFRSFLVLFSTSFRQFWKPFHMHWQDQFSVDPCHLTLCFIVDNWTYQTKLWPCRPANKHQQKYRKKWKRVWSHVTWHKKAFAYSPTHSEYAAYNAFGCLDTWKRWKRFDPTRVNAPKISGSLTSRYQDNRISGCV